MIAAYESRLRKRTALESLQNQVRAREMQLLAVLRILKRELTPEELARVDHCIGQEVKTQPSMMTKLLRRQ